MPDIRIVKYGSRTRVYGETPEGKQWIRENMGKAGTIEFVTYVDIQTELASDFQSSLEADGLTVE